MLGRMPEHSRSHVEPRRCERCGGTFEQTPLTPGWVATTKPRPAWVCPDCTRETGMQPGDPMTPPACAQARPGAADYHGGPATRTRRCGRPARCRPQLRGA